MFLLCVENSFETDRKTARLIKRRVRQNIHKRVIRRSGTHGEQHSRSEGNKRDKGNKTKCNAHEMMDYQNITERN